MKGIEWLTADPYVRRHAAEHAAHGGALDELIFDGGFLAVADPRHLVRTLRSVTESRGNAVASVYRRKPGLLARVDPVERLALLRLLALQERPEVADVFRALLLPSWTARWTWWRRTVPYTPVGSLFDAGNSAIVSAIVHSPAGLPVLVVGVDRSLRCWSLSSLKEITTIEDVGGTVSALAAIPLGGGDTICVGTDGGSLTTFLVPELKRVAEQPHAHTTKVTALTSVDHADETFLVSACEDGAVAVWTLPELGAVARNPRATERTLSLAPVKIRNEPMVVSAGDAAPEPGEPYAMAAVNAWSIPDLRWLGTPDPEARYVRDVFRVPLGDGDIVLIPGLGTVTCWDPDRGATTTFDNKDEYVSANDVVILEAGKTRTLLMASGDGTRFLTVRRTGTQLAVDATPFIDMLWARWEGPLELDGRRFVISAADEIRLWEIDDLLEASATGPRSSAEMFRLQRAYGLLSVTASSEYVWSGSDLGHVIRRRMGNGDSEADPIDAGDSIVALGSGTSSKGEFVAAGLKNGTVQILNSRTGKRIGRSISVGERLRDLVVTRRHKPPVMATVAQDNVYEVRLWSVPSGEPIEHPQHEARSRIRELRRAAGIKVSGSDDNGLTMPGWQDKALEAVTFVESDAGTLVAAGGSPPFVRLWNIETFEPQDRDVPSPGERHTPVTSLAACDTDDGPILVCGNAAGWLQAWSMTRHTSLLEARAHRGRVHVAAGTWGAETAVFSGAQDGTFKVWSTGGWNCIHEIPIGDWIWGIAAVPNGDVAVAARRGLVVLTPGSVLEPPEVQVAL